MSSYRPRQCQTQSSPPGLAGVEEEEGTSRIKGEGARQHLASMCQKDNSMGSTLDLRHEHDNEDGRLRLVAFSDDFLATSLASERLLGDFLHVSLLMSSTVH